MAKRKSIKDFFSPAPKKKCLAAPSIVFQEVDNVIENFDAENENINNFENIPNNPVLDLHNTVHGENKVTVSENALDNGVQSSVCDSVSGSQPNKTKVVLSESYDIGHYIGQSVSNFYKKKILEFHWQPPKNYSFPFSEHGREKKKRFARQEHLDSVDWLVFSPSKQGYFCKFCPLFLQHRESGKGDHQKLGRLVVTPLTSFKNLFGKDGDLTTHAENQYHKNAVLAGKNFLTVSKKPQLAVDKQVDSQKLAQVRENRQRLLPIVKTIILCGKQNIPLRGHRDDGNIIKNNKEEANEGNFRELLRFRVDSGDEQLQNHLLTASSRATYISKTTQNELIECCGEEVLSVIIMRVQGALCLSVIFDETTDIAHISQMSIVLRYVYNKTVYEDFVKFVDLFKALQKEKLVSSDLGCSDMVQEMRLSGKNLGQIVLASLKTFNIDVKKCVGISTDGFIAMVSEQCGAVSEIQTEAIHAVHCPCYNHILNISIGKSSKVTAIKNAVGTMQKTIAFFTNSSKKNSRLLAHLGHHLSGLCETRWVERHDGVLQFRSSLGKIISTLDEISQWTDLKTSSEAKTLTHALCSSEFLISIVCLSDILECTLPLSRLFQKKQIDLKTAQDLLKDCMKLLTRKRDMCDVKFASVFEEVKSLAEVELGTQITMPRIVGRQVHRANYPTRDPMSYYKLSIYLPLIENVIEDLKARFPSDTLKLYNLSILFPTNDYESDDCSQQIRDIAAKYVSFFPNKCLSVIEKNLVAELASWKLKWEDHPEIDSLRAAYLLEECDADIYPYLHCLLTIFNTLPVSIASSERSFSTLRRVKSWLRSLIGEDRLDGLALLNIHREINVDPEKVIDRFAKKCTRRLEFVI